MNDAEIARRSGLPEAVIYAIRTVESGGKNPHAIRFEPRLFLKARPDLASVIPYTGAADPLDHVAADTNRAAMERAMRYDAEQAIRASSFGLYQELGAILLGLTGLPPREALAAFDASPDGMSGEMLLRWIKLNPRVREPALASPPDFLGIATAYNGGGQNAPHYAARLEAAYAQFTARP